MQTPTFLSARSPSVAAAAVDAVAAAEDDPAAAVDSTADEAAGAADDAVVAAVLPQPASKEIDIAAAVSRQTNFFFITCTPLKCCCAAFGPIERNPRSSITNRIITMPYI